MNVSKPTRSLRSFLFFSVIATPFATFLMGCGAQLPARHIKSADLAALKDVVSEQPLVIEFEAGEIIPLTFSLSGPFVQSQEQAPPIPLRVTRHFFLRIDKEGLTSSVDGVNFNEKPAIAGRLQVGVGATKDGVKATISIVTPTPKTLVE